ncbi:MAG: hypothetical protein KME03_13670 [Aphanocapsa lilacina HA4352-LM1]|nr:hypothetical protein [Aphanocapsa lilacina HA4352-LM1]
MSVSLWSAVPVSGAEAVVSLWVGGLSKPQGLATNGTFVCVVEQGTGRVLRYTLDGKNPTLFAQGLRRPSWALEMDGALYVAERDGNSLARVQAGQLSRLDGKITDPLGVVKDPARKGSLLVVSHRTGEVSRYAPDGKGNLKKEEPPVSMNPREATYGWRDIAVAPDGTTYVTDETDKGVYRWAPGEKPTLWAKGFSDPSGLALSPRGEVYVTDLGRGQLVRLDKQGKPTVVADKLGKPREALFIDESTLLVSDEAGGNVYQVRVSRF